MLNSSWEIKALHPETDGLFELLSSFVTKAKAGMIRNKTMDNKLVHNPND